MFAFAQEDQGRPAGEAHAWPCVQTVEAAGVGLKAGEGHAENGLSECALLSVKDVSPISNTHSSSHETSEILQRNFSFYSIGR